MSENPNQSRSEDSAASATVPDGGPMPIKDAPIGGQAVLEGVMMRGVSTWAVAVRKPVPGQAAAGETNGAAPGSTNGGSLGSTNGASPSSSSSNGHAPAEAPLGEIEVTVEPLVAWTKNHRVLRLPIVRGVAALVQSLALGFRALGVSANAQLEDDEPEIGGATWAGTVALSLMLGVGLFFLLPVGITTLFRDVIPNSVVFVIVEKIIRIGIFLGYILLISRMKDLQRVFEYHGAEHKTISCYEAGLPLTPENAQRFSRLHPRCGTSFLLIVMMVAIVVFAPLGTPAWYWLFASRIIGIPLVAGIAFEVLKWFGRNRHRAVARALMWPGMQLQRLTTRQPDLTQLAVAIAALEAVLAVENPTEASEEDRVGMDVVA
ncbi:MAG: DUF1385 domain-containing protein [Thermoleophilaceae bacterium]